VTEELPHTGPDSDLPALSAACALLARVSEPSPLARTVPVIGQLAEGCIGNPGPWRHAEQVWQRVRQTVQQAVSDVTAQRAALAEQWRDAGVSEFGAFAQRFAGQMSALCDLAEATAGAADDLHESFLRAHVRFVAVTVAAAARAQLADLHPEPAAQTVRKTAILGEWMGSTTRVIAESVAHSDRVSDAVAGAFANLRDQLGGASSGLEPAAVAPAGQRGAAIADPRQWTLA
jgi:uncharacterized protein YukE